MTLPLAAWRFCCALVSHNSVDANHKSFSLHPLLGVKNGKQLWGLSSGENRCRPPRVFRYFCFVFNIGKSSLADSRRRPKYPIPPRYARWRILVGDLNIQYHQDTHTPRPLSRSSCTVRTPTKTARPSSSEGCVNFNSFFFWEIFFYSTCYSATISSVRVSTVSRTFGSPKRLSWLR